MKDDSTAARWDRPDSQFDMNDEDFCQIIGYISGFKKELAGKIRGVTASLCKLDPSAITPREDTEILNSRISDGWDDAEFLMQLERVLGTQFEHIRLPNFTMERFFFLHKKAKPLNYGEWVKSVVEMLVPILAEHRGN